MLCGCNGRIKVRKVDVAKWIGFDGGERAWWIGKSVAPFVAGATPSVFFSDYLSSDS